MRERPILFSAPLVRALLAGRKSQTRRPVKPPRQPYRIADVQDWSRWSPCAPPVASVLCERPVSADEVDGKGDLPSGLSAIRCPYGAPGDSLWVRETWRLVDFEFVDGDWNASVEYRADGTRGPRRHGLSPDERLGWRSSIHMHRASSRISLLVTDVRVQRLGEISEEDALAEGMEQREDGHWIGAPHPKNGLTCTFHAAGDAFRSWWRHIYGAYDPAMWVWVVSFRKED